MKTAAIGIVIKNNEVLLVKRRWHPMVWAPPGGFLDPGETQVETVLREVWEETGVQCKALEKVYDFVYDNGYGKSHIHVYACEYISGDLQCSFESSEVKWFPIEHLPHPISPEKPIFQKAIEILNNKKLA
ncbi:NUDIX hydrolase [Crassaminicella profunda]|jgi:8-oxo-dGTP diphosphatase|uniref:NUDIX hydrolase n=1 Tax=Crassaminicella profunda TaxID=1286698 RepID=UPI001CA6D12B|nr:NUDIX hydrolase [Crassaminicella profunda]QZY53658.1 NUDIX hydrolase [Crassaminicella profunda]